MISGSATADAWSDVPDFPLDSPDASLLSCLKEVRSRQVAPELQLLVSQLPSSSLELPVRLFRLGLVLLSLGLGLELCRLPSDLLFIRETDLRLHKGPLKLSGDPLRLCNDPRRHGTDPWRLEMEPFRLVLVELCRLEKEPLSKGEDWRRRGGSSSWSLYGPEKTGQEAVEEQEPRS